MGGCKQALTTTAEPGVNVQMPGCVNELHQLQLAIGSVDICQDQTMAGGKNAMNATEQSAQMSWDDYLGIVSTMHQLQSQLGLLGDRMEKAAGVGQHLHMPATSTEKCTPLFGGEDEGNELKSAEFIEKNANGDSDRVSAGWTESDSGTSDDEDERSSSESAGVKRNLEATSESENSGSDSENAQFVAYECRSDSSARESAGFSDSEQNSGASGSEAHGYESGSSETEECCSETYGDDLSFTDLESVEVTPNFSRISEAECCKYAGIFFFFFFFFFFEKGSKFKERTKKEAMEKDDCRPLT